MTKTQLNKWKLDAENCTIFMLKIKIKDMESESVKFVNPYANEIAQIYKDELSKRLG